MHKLDPNASSERSLAEQSLLNERNSREIKELVTLQRALEVSLAENNSLWETNAALVRELSKQKRLVGTKNSGTESVEDTLQDSLKVATQLRRALIQKERQRFATERDLRNILSTSSYTVTFREVEAEGSTNGAEPSKHDQAQSDKASLRLAVAEKKISELSKELDFIQSSQKSHRRFRNKMVEQVFADISKNGGSETTKHRGGFIFLISYPYAGETYVRDMLGQIEGVHTWRRQSYHQLSALLAVYKRLIGLGASMSESTRALGLHLAECFILSLKLPQDLPASTTVAVNLTSYSLSPADVFEFLDFILTYFPGSRIIFGSRVPEAVASRGNWENQPREEVVLRISELNDAFSRCTQLEDAHQVIRLQYEDRQKRPELVKQIFARLRHNSF